MIRSAFAVAMLAAGALAAGGPRSASAGGGCHAATGLTDRATVSVDLTAACFDPMVVRVDVGDTVTWTNQDSMTHTVTGVAESFGNYDELELGDSASATFETAGVFPYFCVFHPAMVGAVVVGNGVPPGGDDVAAVQPASSGGDGGTSTTTIAGIIAAIGVSGAAVGLVGSRVLSARRSKAEGA